MKAKLEFNLPEDQDDFTLATKGSTFYSVLWSLDKHLRNIIKYEETAHEERIKLAEEIKDIINEEVDLDCVS